MKKNYFKFINKLGKLCLQRKIVKSQDIGNSYTEISDYYDDYYLKEMHVYNNKMLHTLIEKCTGEVTSVLDLACGTGYNSKRLSEVYKDANFTLVDLSSGMLEKAKSKGIPNATYVERDMISFLREQEDNSFDVVICCWAIMYQPPQKIIKEVHRVLKPGGTFGVIVNTRETLPEIRRVYPKLLVIQPKEIEGIMLELPTPKDEGDFQSWFLNASFEVLTVGNREHNFTFKDECELAHWVTHTGALAGFDKMIDLRDERIQSSLTELLKEEGILSVTHKFVWGIFKK